MARDTASHPCPLGHSPSIPNSQFPIPHWSESEAKRDYAAELNEQQFAAVTTRARHALVIAGAGSGKTRTLTYRVSWLVEHGVAPWRILLLTFTNKAAKEMLKRVAELAALDTSAIWGGTFHSVANRMLRRDPQRLGYSANFSILDSDDQNALMKAIYKQHAPKDAAAKAQGRGKKNTKVFPKPKMLLSLHSLAASTGETWQQVLIDKYPEWEEYEDTITTIYEEYAKRKKESNAMDFDDLLTNAVKLLEENEDLRQHYQNRFEHVLVDEYQDTNNPQDRFIALMAGGEMTSLMAVGDDAQSIYSWRGASVEHIFEFERLYPDAELFKIEINYRSVPAILELSNAAIAMNTRQFAKQLRSNRQGGGLMPALVPCADKRMEARFVAQRIDELMGEGLILGRDIAVLYRAHFHAMELQMELLRNHIPFRITSGIRFFEQAHVKDAVAFLRLLVNPKDEIALQRILMMFPRVGAVSAQKISSAWLNQWRSIAAQEEITTLRGRFEQIMGKLAGVTPALKPRWQEFLQLMDELGEENQPSDSDDIEELDTFTKTELTPDQLVGQVLTYLKPYLKATYENAEERCDDLVHLAQVMPNAGSLEEFLAEVSLMSELDNQSKNEGEDDECICLSTIHQAKGLEWKVVFVLSLADGQFPHRRALESGDPTDMEEETRLFYVAVTRAEDQLYLMYPRYSGGYDGQYLPPSCFLSPLEDEHVELWEL